MKIIYQSLVLFFTLLIFAGCNNGPKSAGQSGRWDQTLEFSAYKVPSAQAESLKNVINMMMYIGKDQPPIGRVFLSPGGNKLLVSAPSQFQRGVKTVLEGLKDEGQVKPAIIQTTYWVVMGKPAVESQANIPKDVAPALAEIQNQRGPMSFQVMDRLVTNSLSATKSKVESSYTDIRVVSNQVGGHIILDLDIRSKAHDSSRLQTQLRSLADKFIVLGQSRVDTGNFSKSALGKFVDEKAVDIFYIAKSRVL